jgi:hypothetical protein
MPGNASYSAKMPMIGLPLPYVATKAVGIREMPVFTSKPDSRSLSTRILLD